MTLTLILELFSKPVIVQTVFAHCMRAINLVDLRFNIAFNFKQINQKHCNLVCCKN